MNVSQHPIVQLVRANPQATPDFKTAFSQQATDILEDVRGTFTGGATQADKKETLRHLRALDKALRTMMVENANTTQETLATIEAQVKALNDRRVKGLDDGGRTELHDATLPTWTDTYGPRHGNMVKTGYQVTQPEKASLSLRQTQDMAGVRAFAKNVAQLVSLCSSLATAGPIGLTAANYAEGQSSSQIDGESNSSIAGAGYSAGFFSSGANTFAGSSHGEVHGRSQSTQYSPDFAINTMVDELQHRLEATSVVIPYDSEILARQTTEYHRTNPTLLHPTGGDRTVRYDGGYGYKTQVPAQRTVETFRHQPAFLHMPGDSWAPYETMFTQGQQAPDLH